MVGSDPVNIPENCSVVRLDSEHSTVLFVGGILPSGSLLNWVFGIQFEKVEDDKIVGFMSQSEEKMMLPQPRMMHQSCIVKDANDKQTLLVVGGKIGFNSLQNEYTNTVLGYDLTDFLAGKDSTEEWKYLESMKEARSNFMMTQIENKVYVYGGIKSKDTHIPILNTTVCEVYDAPTNKWSDLEIQGAEPIACFGYTQLAEPT